MAVAAAATSITSFTSIYATKLLLSPSFLRIRPITRSVNLISSPARTTSPSVRFSATSAPSSTTTTISVGAKLPDATLSYFSGEELKTVTVSELTEGKKTIFFAVPGAFTPTCSQKHVPGFIEKAGELKKKGVDVIACVSVNDAFVMKAWKEDLKVDDHIMMLSDGNGVFTKALGVELDLSDKPQGLGVRSRRYALLAEDGVVKVLNLEEGGAFTNSSADEMLKAL